MQRGKKKTKTKPENPDPQRGHGMLTRAQRACMRVSGTYFPPNFANRPKESGRRRRVGSVAICTEAGAESRARVQETGDWWAVAKEGGRREILLRLMGSRAWERRWEDCAWDLLWMVQEEVAVAIVRERTRKRTGGQGNSGGHLGSREGDNGRNLYRL